MVLSVVIPFRKMLDCSAIFSANSGKFFSGIGFRAWFVQIVGWKYEPSTRFAGAGAARTGTMSKKQRPLRLLVCGLFSFGVCVFQLPKAAVEAECAQSA